VLQKSVNLIKNSNEKIGDLLETPKTIESHEITADDSVLIQLSTKTTKVLCAGKVKEKKAFTYKLMVTRRHGETSQFACSDKDKETEIERDDIVTKILRPISLGGTPYTTTLK
jgi:hypothetical protein